MDSPRIQAKALHAYNEVCAWHAGARQPQRRIAACALMAEHWQRQQQHRQNGAAPAAPDELSEHYTCTAPFQHRDAAHDHEASADTQAASRMDASQTADSASAAAQQPISGWDDSLSPARLGVPQPPADLKRASPDYLACASDDDAPEQAKEAGRSKQHERLRRYAMNLVGHRLYTEHAVRQKLRQRQAPVDVADAIVAELQVLRSMSRCAACGCTHAVMLQPSLKVADAQGNRTSAAIHTTSLHVCSSMCNGAFAAH